MLIGAALAFPLPALLTTHFGLPLGGIQIPTNSMQMFSLLFPIFIAVAIARHDLFAIGIIIQRTYGYVLSTRAIVGVYALLVTGLNVTFQSVEVTRSPWFSPAFALGVVFFFGPLHRRLQRFVNRVFYRQQYDYRKTIRDISETMIRLCSQLRHVFLWSRMLTLTTAPATSGDRRVVLPLLGDGRITCDSGTYASRWVGAQSMTRPARRHPIPLPSEGKPVSQESPLERQPPLTSTIRVSAQERDETVQRLQTAFVEGRLNDEEFDERVRAALAARSRVELERLLADLPAPYTRQAQPVRPAPVRRGDSLVIAVMGGAERRGRWRVPEQCTAIAVMGGCSLDLRAAQLSAPVTTINVVAIMGGVEVIVPPGVRVEMHGLPLMGGWSNHVPDAELPPDAPEVHVRGFALMGGVEVRTRKPKRRA